MDAALTALTSPLWGLVAGAAIAQTKERPPPLLPFFRAVSRLYHHLCSPSDKDPRRGVSPAGENSLSVRLQRVWQPTENSYYKAYQR